MVLGGGWTGAQAGLSGETPLKQENMDEGRATEAGRS